MKTHKFFIILVIFVLGLGCTTPKSSLSYGRYIKKNVRTLHSKPDNALHFHVNDFDLFFSIDEMIDILDEGITRFSAKNCIEFMQKDLSGKNPKIYKMNNIIVFDKIKISEYEYIIKYYIEYSMDRLIKKGLVYIIRSEKQIKKIYYKKWIPKKQGTIESKWFSSDGKEINKFDEGNVG